jgi:hypothetical protein
MKKNNFLFAICTSLIMISGLAFSPFQLTRSSDVKLSPAQTIIINSIDAEMQSIAGKYGSLTAITDPGDLLAYRWLAMAKDYVERGYVVSTQPSNISAAGAEMANIVAKYGSLTAISDPGDLLAYRWLAMAVYYGY